ncbi:MAG TPA: glycosyltransferase [Gemmatimonadaceae bacterium]
MKLVVVSHKLCWPSERSTSGYATDGGFPFQMRALAQLFDSTTLVVPVDRSHARVGEIPLDGRAIRVVPLPPVAGTDLRRKLALPVWLLRNLATIVAEVRRADAVHAPIPGDIGTFGLLLALAFRKPLFVRHCGNWLKQKTVAEYVWRWLLDRCAGGRNIVLATGGTGAAPSRNPNVRWIFSTSLTDEEIRACAAPRVRAPTAGPRLIITCRQERTKGTGLVIQTLPILAREFPGISLDVVGNGGALAEFRGLAERLGVADRVRFHGQVDHHGVVALLRDADLFCFPTSAPEGFPKAVLEAMACGLPVVTTHVSVLPQLVAGGGGVLLDETSPAAIAVAVRRCVSDLRVYEAMSRAAVDTASRYSLERWRDTIGGSLAAAWGELRSHA